MPITALQSRRPNCRVLLLKPKQGSRPAAETTRNWPCWRGHLHKILLLDPPTVVIDALLEEGDWRAAAEIAKDHDPLKQDLIEGFDDHRPMQAVDLYTHLAFAAAWKGDDAAAAALLAQAKNIPRTDIHEDDGPMPDQFPWYETLLAGLAEGRLPRKYIYLFTGAFRSPY